MGVRDRLNVHMGRLLGPRPMQEIVITRYEDDRINYQIEGMGQPVPPEVALQLLTLVAAQIAPPQPQETP